MIGIKKLGLKQMIEASEANKISKQCNDTLITILIENDEVNF